MMNRHPVIIDQLGPLLPPGGRRPETRLQEDLRIPPLGNLGLAQSCNEAWGITLSQRDADSWRTLADVAASIADSLQMVAA